MRHLVLVLASAVLAFGAELAHAEPFTVSDLLRIERFGQVALSPEGQALVFEKLGPAQDSAVSEYDYLDQMLRSELLVASGESDPQRLLADDEGKGQVIGSWAPDGARLLIYRLHDRQFTAGLVEVKTGDVQWLDGTPEAALWGRSAQWRSSNELLMLMRADGDLPPLMRVGWQAADRLQHQWAETRGGLTPARTILGSGAFSDLNARPSAGRLVQVQASSGVVHTLVEGRFYDMELSPDGRYVALARFAEIRPFDPTAPFFQGDFSERRELSIVDLETGDVWTPSRGSDLAPHLLAWSPRGELLTWMREDGQSWTEGRLLRFLPSRRRVETVPLHGLTPSIVQTGLRTEIVSATWLGSMPVLYAQRRPGRADWVALDHGGARALTKDLSQPGSRLLATTSDHLVVRADGGAWRLDREGHALRLGDVVAPMGSAFASLFSQGQRFQFNSAPPADWLTVGRGQQRQRVEIDTGKIFGDAVEGGPTLVAVGKTAAAERDIDDHYREGLIFNGRVLLRLNPAFDAVTFIRPSPVVHPDDDGSVLTSWLYRPILKPGAVPPPLIVVPYPGSQAAIEEPTEASTMTNVQLMVAAGYAVLVPSLPRARNRGEPAEGMAADILRAVDAAATLGDFDPDRLVLWGHSFGGYAALTAATQSDRFTAVIAANGPYDLLSVWGQFALAQGVVPEDGLPVRSRAAWVETGQGGLGGPPWSDLDRYVRNSPAFAIDRVTAPVLLITGDRDFVPAAQAEEAFSGLYRQQKDVVLITYRGEGHVLSSPANIRDMYANVWAWLHRVLAPDPGGAG